ncbi:MAG TPA: hypothetical protein VFS21_33315 [Roseiflexaceae bacterium]|nr:hypothetical protein [Roseiflexaceae bacterium]
MSNNPDDEIIIRYHPDRNPEGAAFPGVPLADLTRAQVAQLPPWQIRSVVRSPFYTRVRRRAPAPPPAGQEPESEALHG